MLTQIRYFLFVDLILKEINCLKQAFWHMTVSRNVEYGTYEITDYLELEFQNIKIKIEKVIDNAFTYLRKDAEGNIVEKIIPIKENKLMLELCPIRPLNYPARRTEYVYLNLDKEIFLSESSAASIFIQCPIEIGVFLVHGQHKDSLDWFTCDPLNARFGLFGPPDSGTLCKFFKAHVVESCESSDPFLNAVVQINFENQLDIGHPISKVVFPIINHSIYYKGTLAAIDTVNVILRKIGLVKYGDVEVAPFTVPEWIKSPSLEHNIITHTIEMGLD